MKIETGRESCIQMVNSNLLDRLIVLAGSHKSGNWKGCLEEKSDGRLLEKQLFLPDEVRDLMRLKTMETVHGWIRAGKIKYVITPGGQKRIPRAEVERITRELQEKQAMRS